MRTSPWSALRRVAPIVDWLPRYERRDLSQDVVAGLTTAVLIIPQGMAYAMLAGLPPQMGLYASIVPMLAYALFGTSRQLSVGPVAMDSLLVLAGLSVLAEPGSDAFIGYAIVLALLVGLIQVAMGIGRLGFFVNFLARPTIVGFTAAAALIIATSQLPALLGLSAKRSSSFVESIAGVFDGLSSASLATTLVGVASIGILLAMKRWAPRWPRALFVVVGASVVTAIAGSERLSIALIGGIPSSLPTLSVPPFDGATLMELLALGVTIALVSFMETISAGKQFARQYGYEVSPNQELIGVGAANIAGSLFGGYPVAGGLSRSVVNAQAGARTQLSAVITSLTVALSLVFFARWFAGIPRAALAAIIIVSVAGLFDVAEMRRLARVKFSDFAITAVTFAATLALGIQAGILTGIGISLAVFLVRTTKPHAAVLGRVPETTAYRNVVNYPQAITWDSLMIVRVDAQFYFGNVTFLKDVLHRFEQAQRAPIEAVIIDASSINQLDSSADAALHQLAEQYAGRGVRLYFANVKQPVREVMIRSGFIDRLGESRFFLSVHDAVQCVRGLNTFCTDVEARQKEDERMLDLTEAVSITSTDVPEVTVEWLQDHQARVRIVDVREAAELSGPLGVIDGIEHIPLGQLERRIDDFDKSAPVVFVCRSGGRSATAAQIFQRHGLLNVASLADGMTEWNRRGLPVASHL